MTKYSHSSLCHAMLFCNQNMVVLLIHLALTKYYCCSNETMCWHFDKKAQEQIFEDNPVWFEISGMGVMGRFTRPLPLPAPLELPAPYPILPLPDWGLGAKDWAFRGRRKCKALLLSKQFCNCAVPDKTISDLPLDTKKKIPHEWTGYCRCWHG